MAVRKHRNDQLFVAPVEFAGPVEFGVPPTGLPGHSDPILLGDGSVADPTYSFTSDRDTGQFLAGPDVLGFAAGGVEATRFTELNGSVVAAPEANVGLTADVGSAQGDGVITSSYNVYSTVATAGDAATLPAVFAINSLIYIKNDGAESMDVFPALDDNAGAGVNTAIAIPSGESKTFIATVADATWTELLVSGGGATVLTDLSDVVSATNTDKFALMANGTTGYVGRALLEADISDLQSYLLSVPSPLIIPTGGNASVPKLAFGDGDTGFYQVVDDFLRIAIAGTDRWSIGSNEFKGIIDGGAMLLDLNATATIPPYTFSNDPDTGIGSGSLDTLSLIAGGVEIARATEAVAANQFAVVSSGSSAVPDLGSLADADTGLGWTGGNQLVVIAGGSPSWNFTTGQFFSQFSAGPALANLASGFAIANVLPNRGDPDTGLGGDGADKLSLIAGGVEAMRFTEAAAVITATLAGNLTVTGKVGANQGAGPAMLNEDASSTNPTLVPNQADDDTGIGRDTIDGLAFIAGGVSCMRVREIAAAPAVGLYTTTPIVQQTGVAVTAAGIHAALVNLGAFTA